MLIQTTVLLISFFMLTNWGGDDIITYIINIPLLITGIWFLFETILIFFRGMGGSLLCRFKFIYRLLRPVVYIIDIIVYTRGVVWYISFWQNNWLDGGPNDRIGLFLLFLGFVFSVWGVVLFLGVSLNFNFEPFYDFLNCCKKKKPYFYYYLVLMSILVLPSDRENKICIRKVHVIHIKE